MPSSVSSRRGLLGRGLLVAAGVVGLGGAVRHSSATTAVSGPSRHAPSSSCTDGISIYTLRPGGRASFPGRAIATPRTRSCSTARGMPRSGHFSAAHLSLDSPFAAASSLEIHTFDLPDGTLHGLGTAAGERTATS